MTTHRTVVLDEVGNPNAERGSRPWAIHMRGELQRLMKDAESDAIQLEFTRDAMIQHEGWRVLDDAAGRPFSSFEAFCSAKKPFGLGYNRDFIDRIISDRKAKTAQEHATQEAAGQGRMILDSGPPTKEEQANRNQITDKPIPRGTDPGYLTARIARDRPDILERMQAGEFPSVRAAALEAGIVKPTATVRVDDPRVCARALTRRFDRAELMALIEELRTLLQEGGERE